jgi:hypothetical protein
VMILERKNRMNNSKGIYFVASGAVVARNPVTDSPAAVVARNPLPRTMIYFETSTSHICFEPT